MGEEPAFREAVLRHRSVTNAEDYERVWSLLEPIARVAPTVAIRVAGPALDSLDPSERAVAADLLGLVAGLHAKHRTAIVRRLLVRSKTEHAHPSDIDGAGCYRLHSVDANHRRARCPCGDYLGKG